MFILSMIEKEDYARILPSTQPNLRSNQHYLNVMFSINNIVLITLRSYMINTSIDLPQEIQFPQLQRLRFQDN